MQHFCPIEDIGFYESLQKAECGLLKKGSMLNNLQVGASDNYGRMVEWLRERGVDVFVPKRDDWFEQANCGIPFTFDELSDLCERFVLVSEKREKQHGKRNGDKAKDNHGVEDGKRQEDQGGRGTRKRPPGRRRWRK